jgi:hypothetical protein
MNRRDLTSDTAQDKHDVEAEARRRGIEPYQVRATGAVNDRLMRDLVSDFRRGVPQSASLIPDPRSEDDPPSPKGNGWVDAAPLVPPRGRWRETEDEKRSRIAAQQAAELAEIEDRLGQAKGPRIETEWNPFDREHMRK